MQHNSDPAFMNALTDAVQARLSPTPRNRVVVAVHGKNQRGIVAAMATAINRMDGDIHDLSQSIVRDFFHMLFVVNLGQSSENPSGGTPKNQIQTLREALQAIGDALGVSVVVTHEDILSSMHRI